MLKNIAKSSRPAIDSLLGQIDERASLELRIQWIIKLFAWIQYDSGTSASTHIRYIFTVLERNSDLKLKIARTLRSIIRDLSAFDLFVYTGIGLESNILAEIYERLLRRILPRPPKLHDFSEVFHLLFPDPEQARWILELPDEDMAKIAEFLHYGEDEEKEYGWNSLYSDMKEAIFCLTRQIQILMFSPAIRLRMGKAHIHDLAFYHLDATVERVLVAQPNELAEALKSWEALRAKGLSELNEARNHLENHGVSLSLVYRMEMLQFQLDRLTTLLNIYVSRTGCFKELRNLFFDLAKAADDQTSISALFGENIALLSKRITETNAESGDHYICRNRKQMWTLFAMAAGGGVITCVTVLGKTHFEQLHVNAFLKGFIVSTNYAVSFLAIQWLGLTLATKQPAVTAAALAANMKRALANKDYPAIVTEVVCLIRSQVVAIIGNVITVAPLLILLELAMYSATEIHLLAPEYAHKIIKSHSIWGLTPLFAALTGLLLWISAQCAGWIKNWFLFRELPEAIEQNKTIVNALGWNRAKRFANYLRENIAGLGGNVSLGFLLGMTPKITAFFGILIDVRHVTLSTGMVALAAAVIGPEILTTEAFFLALAGLFAAGVLNVAVSFGIALWIAIRAQQLRNRERVLLYKTMGREFWRKPWRIFKIS